VCNPELREGKRHCGNPHCVQVFRLFLDQLSDACLNQVHPDFYLSGAYEKGGSDAQGDAANVHQRRISKKEILSNPPPGLFPLSAYDARRLDPTHPAACAMRIVRALLNPMAVASISPP
jgi:hypothetical protein